MSHQKYDGNDGPNKCIETNDTNHIGKKCAFQPPGQGFLVFTANISKG